MNNGWIKLHRKMVEWEWYSDVNTKALFLHLLLNANHKDKRWKGIEVKRGQCITGLFQLSSDLGISVQSIRTSLKRLKSTSEVTIKATNHFSIITLNKYDTYNEKEITTNKPTNKPVTNHQQATNNKQEGKKEKKNKHREFVFLSQDELIKLQDKFGIEGTSQRIDSLNEGIGSKGYKYKSHYHTILAWDRKNNKQDNNNGLVF